MRRLGIQDIEDIALGAAVMASGGGGNPAVGILMAQQAVREFGSPELISLEELEDDACVAVSMGLGAPTVLVEKVPAGFEPSASLDALEHATAVSFDAVMPAEAGGWNSLHPVLCAARKGLKLVDADGMGRAFPELQMVTWSLRGLKACPVGIADERGNRLTIEAVDNRAAERLCRDAAVLFGGNISMAAYAMTGAEAKRCSIPGTYLHCGRVGRIIRELSARRRGSAADELMDALRALELFRGKVQDVDRRTVGGFARGATRIEGTDSYRGSVLELGFQNEFLIAERDGEVVCSTPDLIALLDSESYRPITGESLKYGCRVIALGIPCAQEWRSPQGLSLVGPEAFGYEGVSYVPVEGRAT